jgi:hypothetical protein
MAQTEETPHSDIRGAAKAAISQTKEYSIYRISRLLHSDFKELKSRMSH